MEATEVLTLIAEIGIALAGFTAVVTVVGRPPGPLSALEAFRLSQLLALSLGAVALALLPLGLYHLGIDAPRLWQISSAAMAILGAGLLLGHVYSTRRFLRGAPGFFNRILVTTLVLTHIGNIGLQIAHALGAVRPASPGVFLIGLYFYVIHGGLMFVRVIFIRSKTS